MPAHRRSPRRPAGRRCSSARLAGAGCPRADRYRRRRPHSVLRFRAHPVANAGLCRAGDLQPGAAVRDRGPRLRKPDRAAARLPPSVRCRTGRLPAQRPAGGAAAPAGIGGGRWQKFLTVAAMAGLVTAVLVGSAAGCWQPSSLTTRSSRCSSPASWSPSRCSPRRSLPGLDLAAGGGGPARRRVSGNLRVTGRFGPAACTTRWLAFESVPVDPLLRTGPPRAVARNQQFDGSRARRMTGLGPEPCRAGRGRTPTDRPRRGRHAEADPPGVGRSGSCQRNSRARWTKSSWNWNTPPCPASG